MSLSGLLPVINSDPDLQAAVEQAVQLPALGGDMIAPAALRPLLVAALTGHAAGTGSTGAGSTGTGAAGQPDSGRPFVLAVTATAREAEELAAALGSLLAEDVVGYFPAWETLPHERLSPRSDTSGQRLAILRRLAHPDPSDPRSGALAVVTTPVRSLLQPMVNGLGELAPVKLATGQKASLEDTVTHLVEIGYARVDLVERRGEIAVRGGLLDVFPPTDEHPLRIEFWGDEIEEIRYFKAAALPGAAADAGRARSRTPARVRVAGPTGHPRQDGRGHHRRGHGGAGTGAHGQHGTAAQLPAGREQDRRLRSRAHPRQGGGPGVDEPGVPRGLVGECGRRG